MLHYKRNSIISCYKLSGTIFTLDKGRFIKLIKFSFKCNTTVTKLCDYVKNLRFLFISKLNLAECSSGYILFVKLYIFTIQKKFLC